MAVLIVSNGHGEDALAAVLAKKLRDYLEHEILALPLVGLGLAYDQAGIKKVHSQPLLPSGGFAYLGWKNLRDDLASGLFKQITDQKKVLRNLKDIQLAICVGDTYNLFLTALNLKTEIVFIPTAKSNYIKPHSNLEVAIMRKKALFVLPRDEITAKDLRKRKVKANCLGNLMMDAIDLKGIDFNLPNPIGILPGSRKDAPLNLKAILQVVEKTKIRDHYLVALTKDFDIASFVATVDWQSDTSQFATCVLKKDTKKVYLCQDLFGDIIRQSEIVIGLSGTGNEQAAGFGKPVVTFIGEGTQFTAYFARKQKKLLGEAVFLVEAGYEQVAKAVDHLALHPLECYHRGLVGKERMGAPGASKKMAVLISAILKREVVF